MRADRDGLDRLMCERRQYELETTCRDMGLVPFIEH